MTLFARAADNERAGRIEAEQRCNHLAAEVARLTAELDEARQLTDNATALLAAECRRLRARVRVEAEDVERAGVTRQHVVAWMRANGWGAPTLDRFGWVSAESETGGEPVDLWRGDGSTPLDRTIRFIADDLGRPSMTVLDEMAAMEVGP